MPLLAFAFADAGLIFHSKVQVEVEVGTCCVKGNVELPWPWNMLLLMPVFDLDFIGIQNDPIRLASWNICAG
jgi:hypothetical protein